jgi:hypothetical protein
MSNVVSLPVHKNNVDIVQDKWISVSRHIFWISTSVALALSLSASTPMSGSSSYKILDYPNNQRIAHCIDRIIDYRILAKDRVLFVCDVHSRKVQMMYTRGRFCEIKK